MSKEFKQKLCPLCKSLPLTAQNALLFCTNCNIYAGAEHTYEQTFESPLTKSALEAPMSYYGMHHKTDNTSWYATAFTLWFASTMAIMVFSPTLALF